ncbi:Vesicle-trafficking protein SEC22c [Bagarius yarrelli]|uniref:Vesicle-trafficking protein SEC22c n=1 Tax=Bagarius yarrelli TaxID=175774 RepID=A0A556TWJ2_BAGYA|nr:Vesicle-trafficking protein SEC22c [Bagarius yarrelli]
MSLIVFVLVARLRDGLPLSASTDFQHSRELQERKQQIRTISKSLNSLPERGIITGQELHIYFYLSDGMAYLSVCLCSVSAAVAFSFLEDLRWAFMDRFDSSAVAQACRPYPFLDFDGVIQKLQQHYNQNGGPALEITLSTVQEELSLSPPHVLTMDEIQLSNGVANGHAEQAAASGQMQRLEPVSAPGILSLVLNIMCAALNLIRGVHLIEYTFQDDYDSFWNVTAFLVAFACCVCQCQLYLFHSSRKKIMSLMLLTVIIVCNGFLFGLRNIWQLTFHVSVALISTLLILKRKLLDRSSDCGV